MAETSGDDSLSGINRYLLDGWEQVKSINGVLMNRWNLAILDLLDQNAALRKENAALSKDLKDKDELFNAVNDILNDEIKAKIELLNTANAIMSKHHDHPRKRSASLSSHPEPPYKRSSSTATHSSKRPKWKSWD